MECQFSPAVVRIKDRKSRLIYRFVRIQVRQCRLKGWNPYLKESTRKRRDK